MRRHVTKAVVGVGLFVLVAGSWSAWRATQARADLLAAEALTQSISAHVEARDWDASERELAALKPLLLRASDHTGGPMWRVAEHIPILGRNFRATRTIADGAEALGERVVPELSAAAALARRGGFYRERRLDLHLLSELHGHFRIIAEVTAQAERLVGENNRLLLPPVSGEATRARSTFRQLAEKSGDIEQALAVAPSMLGQTKPRTFFVAVQNNAESRATGGLLGLYAIVRVHHGSISLVETGIDTDLRNSPDPILNDPAAAATWTDIGSTQAWQDVNLTPHFPDVAQNIAGLWQFRGGAPLDGIVAIDPHSMSQLLEGTEPIKLADGTAIDPANLMQFIGSDEYLRYQDHLRRKLLLESLAHDLFARVAAPRDPHAMLRALIDAANSGHMFLWSAVDNDERVLSRHKVGGALPPGTTPYLSVVTQNFGGNKLDFYLHRRITVTRQPDGLLAVDVTLVNKAPRGLPDYVVGRPSKTVPYALSKLSFAVYASRDSDVYSVELDGKAATMLFDRDHGLLMGTLVVNVPRSAAVHIRIVVSQPPGVLRFRRQPLVSPDSLDIAVPHAFA